LVEGIGYLGSVPSEAWMVLTGAIIGSGLTLVGVWLTNRSSIERLHVQLAHERHAKREELYRARLEELYVESRKYFDAIVSHYLPYRKVMRGELTFSQAQEVIITTFSKKDYEPHRVTMLIDIYFPELKSPFQELIEIRDRLGAMIDGYKARYKTGDTDGSKWLEKFQPSFEELEKQATKVEELVASLKIKA